MKKYFTEENGTASGPYSIEDLKNKTLKKNSLIWFNPIYAIESEKSAKRVIKTSNLEGKYLH